jgi:microcompartment protein CcmK/EutM
MTICRVLSAVVATEKHPDYLGLKMLLVQPVTPSGAPKGKSLVAVDAVQAGIGDLVLVVDEGGSARTAIGEPDAMRVRTAICGIVDRIDFA